VTLRGRQIRLRRGRADARKRGDDRQAQVASEIRRLIEAPVAPA
jgi:hypothetical protein